MLKKKKTPTNQPTALAPSSFCAVRQKGLCAKSRTLLLHPRATSFHVAASMLHAGEGAFVSDFLVPHTWKGSRSKQKGTWVCSCGPEHCWHRSSVWGGRDGSLVALPTWRLAWVWMEKQKDLLYSWAFWHSQCNSQCYGPLYGITCIYCLGSSYKGSPEASQYHLLVFYEMNFSQGHSSCCSAKRKTFWLRNKKTSPQCYHPGAHLAPARRLNLTPRFLLWPWQDWNLSVSFNAFILCFIIMLLWPQWSEDIKEMRLAVAPSWEKKEEIHLSFLLGNSKEGERLYLQQCSGFSGRLYKLVLKIQFKILKIN